MNRLVFAGIAVSLAAVISILIVPRAHPRTTGQSDAPPGKRPRVKTATAPPAPVGGFSGVLPPTIPPADRRANILRLLAAGEFFPAQTAISEWYSTDPTAAKAWLESKSSFGDFQPAISQIARDVAESGHPAEALEWADLLQAGPERDQTIFQIYATGRRYHWLSDEQIRAAPFPPKKIADLLSGAADD